MPALPRSTALLLGACLLAGGLPAGAAGGATGNAPATTTAPRAEGTGPVSASPLPPSAAPSPQAASSRSPTPAPLPGTIAALVQESQRQSRIAPVESRRLAELALQRLAGEPDAELSLRAHLLLCEYHAEGDRAAAEQHLRQSAALVPQTGRPGLRARMLNCEGELAEHSGDTSRAAMLYEQALLVAEQTRDDEMLADALYKRGFLRGVRGEFGPGLEDLKRSLVTYERLQMQDHLLTVHNAIATLFNRLGDFATARIWYERALREQVAAGLRRESIVTRHNLGRVLENLKDWPAARQAFEGVLAASRELMYERGEAYALRGLASVRNAEGNPEAALRLLAEAQRLLPRVTDARLEAQIALERGHAMRLLQRPQEAVASFEGALRGFQKAEAMGEQAAAHGALAQTYALLGDFRRAYENEVGHRELTRRLLERQRDDRFASLKVDYDRAARDQEMKLLQREQHAVGLALSQEQRANQLQSVALALGSVLVLVLGLLLWRHRRTSDEMRRLAMTDELTGLPNRRDVLARLDTLLASAEPACAVLIIDLDHFKAINDLHGHLGGDQMLRAVASQLRDTGRDPVHLGRLGGEEFVLVLPRAGIEAARTVAERLRAGVAGMELGEGPAPTRITISVGVAVAAPGDSTGILLRRADAALYAAKRGGRNRVNVQVGEPLRAAPPASVSRA